MKEQTIVHTYMYDNLSSAIKERWEPSIECIHLGLITGEKYEQAGQVASHEEWKKCTWKWYAMH